MSLLHVTVCVTANLFDLLLCCCWQLHLEAPHEPTTGTKEKDVDFFEEHSSKESEFDNDNQVS